MLVKFIIKSFDDLGGFVAVRGAHIRKVQLAGSVSMLEMELCRHVTSDTWVGWVSGAHEIRHAGGEPCFFRCS